MTLRSGVVTFTGAAQSLASILGTGVLDASAYAVDIQADSANAAVFYVGGADVAATNGMRIPIPVSSVPSPPYRIGDFNAKGLKLADIYVLGTTNQKAHVLAFV